MRRPPAWRHGELRSERGSVLFIVMIICLGLVTLVVYFAYAVNSELQASANRVGEIEARAAVTGGARYAAYILNNFAIDGVVPHSGIVPDPTQDYYSSALAVGDDPANNPQFWFIGRDPNNPATTQVVFSLVDEASKLNLNTATATMLEALPLADLTTDFATAIVNWRTRSTTNSSSTASLYSTLDPARVNKAAPFETTDELRLVYGATLDLILGEDTNRNGALDPSEDDGDLTPPHDNQDGQLQPGMLEYVTAFSNQPNTTLAGGQRMNITTAQGRARLQALLTGKGIAAGRAATIVRNTGTGTFTSVADFMLTSRMTAAEFALVHTAVTAATGTAQHGLVNVNTASEEVLACIPGIGPNSAPAVVAYRLANPTLLTSFAWLSSVLSAASIRRAGPYITDQSYQFSADIAAVGRNGRGYHREKLVFDTSQGIPRIIYRQDLTGSGWALGPQIRQGLKTVLTY
jgi:DNA uptake protein ComE-like DNA-binding protein